jgi:hypothetical protein
MEVIKNATVSAVPQQVGTRDRSPIPSPNSTVPQADPFAGTHSRELDGRLRSAPSENERTTCGTQDWDATRHLSLPALVGNCLWLGRHIRKQTKLSEKLHLVEINAM